MNICKCGSDEVVTTFGRHYLCLLCAIAQLLDMEIKHNKILAKLKQAQAEAKSEPDSGMGEASLNIAIDDLIKDLEPEEKI